MRERTRGCMWLIIGLVMALLAGAVGWWFLTTLEDRQPGEPILDVPDVTVVVAAREIPVRAALTGLTCLRFRVIRSTTLILWKLTELLAAVAMRGITARQPACLMPIPMLMWAIS